MSIHVDVRVQASSAAIVILDDAFDKRSLDNGKKACLGTGLSGGVGAVALA